MINSILSIAPLSKTSFFNKKTSPIAFKGLAKDEFVKSQEASSCDKKAQEAYSRLISKPVNIFFEQNVNQLEEFLQFGNKEMALIVDECEFSECILDQIIRMDEKDFKSMMSVLEKANLIKALKDKKIQLNTILNYFDKQASDKIRLRVSNNNDTDEELIAEARKKEDRAIFSTKKADDDNENISSHNEFIFNGEFPNGALIHSKESDVLSGAFESRIYDLSKFPQDQKLSASFNPNTQESDGVISTVQQDGNKITYQETYSYLDTLTKRNYSQTKDENGTIVAYEYSYHIEDKNGNPVFNLERSWEKIDENKTRTIINGKVYETSYDDKTMEIRISHDGKDEILKFAQNHFLDFSKYKPEDAKNLLDKYSSFDEAKRAMFNSWKQLPADQLLALEESNLEILIIPDSIQARVENSNKILRIGENNQISCHELGHTKQYGAVFLDEVRSTYKKEMQNFILRNSADSRKILSYFTLDNEKNGIFELAAEANVLLTTYGEDKYKNQRALYLTRYFPQTIAKIGEALGYNNVNKSN